MPCHVRLRWPKQLSNVLSDCPQKLNGLENLKFFGWPKKVLGSIDREYLEGVPIVVVSVGVWLVV